MKHLFTLAFALLASVATSMAQTVTITKTDGSTVTYKASEIKNIQSANEEEPVKPLHSFTGYITVSSAFFMNTYYGEEAKMEVYTQGDKTYCKFSDPKWGTGVFDIKLDKGHITGTGTMSIVDPTKGGAAKEYKAMMAGPMTSIRISVTGLMGGTTIVWKNGKAPEDVKFSGTYMGENVLTVKGMGSYTNSNAGHSFWINADGTYSIMILGQKYAGTPMGDLTISPYTINNLTYDETTKSFSKDYTADAIKVKLKGVQDGEVKIDGQYQLKGATIKATFDGNGNLKVENNFQPGNMPMPITGVFNGKISK